jgi:hypothetical protein
MQPCTNVGMTTEMSGRRALNAEGRECFAPIQACCFSYIDAKYSNELLASDKSVGPFQAQ